MRKKDPLEGMAVFLAVAELRSFSAASRRLGISVSAASQAVRRLEARVGMTLLRRSTRSISLTDHGAEYAARAGAAWQDLLRATEDIARQAGRPSGALRLTMPRSAFDSVVAPALASFQLAYPAIEVEISVDGKLVDIVADGFDAGFRYGDLLAPGMIAVKLRGAAAAVLAAAPAYLRTCAALRHPADLLAHSSILCRSQSNGVVRVWPLQRRGKSIQVAPTRRMIVGDLASQLDMMTRGLGIGSAASCSLAPLLESGALVRVLPEWSIPMQALFLYYPDRQQCSTALRAFIEHLRSGVRAC